MEQWETQTVNILSDTPNRNFLNAVLHWQNERTSSNGLTSICWYWIKGRPEKVVTYRCWLYLCNYKGEVTFKNFQLNFVLPRKMSTVNCVAIHKVQLTYMLFSDQAAFCWSSQWKAWAWYKISVGNSFTLKTDYQIPPIPIEMTGLWLLNLVINGEFDHNLRVLSEKNLTFAPDVECKNNKNHAIRVIF